SCTVVSTANARDIWFRRALVPGLPCDMQKLRVRVVVLVYSRVQVMRIGWARLKINAWTRLLVTCGFTLHSLLLIGCAALHVIGIVSSWWASAPRFPTYEPQGTDFVFPYMLSHSVLHGEPIYDRQWQLENIPAIT